MAGNTKEYTYSLYVGDTKIDRLTEEQKVTICERLSVIISKYVTSDPDRKERFLHGDGKIY